MKNIIKQYSKIMPILLLIFSFSCISNSSVNQEPNISTNGISVVEETFTEEIPKTPLPTSLPHTPIPTEVQATVKISNVALGKYVAASNSRAANPASIITDGINHSENFWSANDIPPQWIEIDLDENMDIFEIKLIVFQYPDGESLHEVSVRSENSNDYIPLQTFNEYTVNGQELIIIPTSPLIGIRYIRVDTISSAITAYAEWREIEVYGIPSGMEIVENLANEPDIIFYNGNIITMDVANPQFSAIAIKGEEIFALGNDVELTTLKGPGTELIDLEGKTIIPGFVDAHTHILKDTGIGIASAQQLALENGITTLTEMTTLPDFLGQMTDLALADQLRVRVTAYLAANNPCGESEGDWYYSETPNEEIGSNLQIGGVKIFADGGVCGGLATTFEYGAPPGYGDLWLSDQEMNSLVSDINDAGFQVAIHAQGDRAIEQSLNAIEFALNGGENLPRHRMEHNPFVRSDLLPRYSEVGVVPTIVGFYPTCAETSRQAYSNYFGLENVYWLEDWRSFIDANPDLLMAWHGDDPWMVPVSPLIELHSLVTRKEMGENGVFCDPPDWLASHAITVEEALPMMTINSAYALFRDDEVGSLVPGKFADLLVLSGNPMENLDDILNIEILLTMVGGKSEYCGGENYYCP